MHLKPYENSRKLGIMLNPFERQLIDYFKSVHQLHSTISVWGTKAAMTQLHDYGASNVF